MPRGFATVNAGPYGVPVGPCQPVAANDRGREAGRRNGLKPAPFFFKMAGISIGSTRQRPTAGNRRLRLGNVAASFSRIVIYKLTIKR